MDYKLLFVDGVAHFLCQRNPGDPVLKARLRDLAFSIQKIKQIADFEPASI
jgi:hypothetical protein